METELTNGDFDDKTDFASWEQLSDEALRNFDLGERTATDFLERRKG